MRFTWFGSKYVRRDCQFVQKAIRSQRLPRIEVRRSKSTRPIQSLTRDPSPSNHPPPASGPTVEPIVPATSDSTPYTSTPAPPTSTPPSLTPFKQQRPFSSGSPGITTWYTTSTAHDIVSPPGDITPAIGDLYVHHNRVTDIYHVWLWGMDHQWKCVTNMEKVYHPVIDDRVLSMRANGTPNWITAASYTTIRGRRGKVRISE